MSSFETALGKSIQLDISPDGHRLFRCNSGYALQSNKKLQPTGHGMTKGPRRLILENPYWIKLHEEGTPDYCGWTIVEITPEMVGHKIPVFTGVEVKSSKGKLATAQRRVMRGLRRANAIAGKAKKASDFWEILRSWKQGFEHGQRGANQ